MVWKIIFPKSMKSIVVFLAVLLLLLCMVSCTDPFASESGTAATHNSDEVTTVEKGVSDVESPKTEEASEESSEEETKSTVVWSPFV